ncbi:MAG: response regulator [Alphaproteobacteria bacterium]
MAEGDYEVHVSDDGPWFVDGVFDREDKAVARAHAVVRAGQSDTVRVFSERERGRSSTVFQSPVARQDAEPAAELEASGRVCSALSDFYHASARLTGSRIFRDYLAPKELTFLELLHDNERLRELNREERTLRQFIRRVARVQAGAVGCTEDERAAALLSFFTHVRERALSADTTAGLATLAQNGMDALLAKMVEGGPPEEMDIRVSGVLAAYLGRAPDLHAKVGLILGLFGPGCGNEGRVVIDGVLAEILDVTAVVRDLVGTRSDLGDATLSLCQLATGQWIEPRGTSPLAERLNIAVNLQGLPETRAVLLDRVVRTLRRGRHLSRDGSADRAAVLTLVTTLCAPAGLWGGGAMSEALIGQVRRSFGANGEHLSFKKSLDLVLRDLPSGVAGLGFLLDITSTPLWGRFQGDILRELLSRLDGIRSITDLLPEGDANDPAVHDRTLRDLGQRLNTCALPQDVTAMLAAQIGKFLKAAPPPEPPGQATPSNRPEREGTPINAPPGPRIDISRTEAVAWTSGHYSTAAARGTEKAKVAMPPPRQLDPQARKLVRILLIESNPQLREVIRDTLSGEGFGSIIALPSLGRVKDGFVNLDIDVIVINSRVEGGDACDLVRKLRFSHKGRNPFISVILSIEQEDTADLGKFINSGADHIVVRPFSAKSLIDRIESLVDRRQPFVATSTYIGPDRRSKARPEEGEPEIPVFVVPNTLKLKAQKRTITPESFQKVIDATLERMNVEMIDKLAFQIVFQQRRLKDALRTGIDPLTPFDDLKTALDEYRRRINSAMQASIGELAFRLDGRLNDMGNDFNAVSPRDMELVEKLSMALYMATTGQGDPSALASKVNRALATFEKKMRAKKARATPSSGAKT